MPRDQTFEHDLLVKRSSGSDGKHIRRHASTGIPQVHFVTVPNAQEGPITVGTERTENYRVRRVHISIPEADGGVHTATDRRQLANAWDEFFNHAAIDHGFHIGLSSPCLYFHREANSHAWRHGDDLVLQGEDKWLDELQKALERVVILKETSNIGTVSRRCQTRDYLEQVDRPTRQWRRTGRDAGTRPTAAGLFEGSVRSLGRSRRWERRRLTTTMKRCRVPVKQLHSHRHR